jgi:hypothetical protein
LNLDSAGTIYAEAMTEAAREFAASTGEERGAIFTRREVVDFILDLVGYAESNRLADARLLEPSVGHGDFLLPAIGRLVRSFFAHGGSLTDAPTALSSALLAFEVHKDSLETARKRVIAELVSLGVSTKGAKLLASRWLVEGDFLLASIKGEFSHVVGNPPYVRQELIPGPLLETYRARYSTLYDRADLYIPFFERSLELLAPAGRMGFICTDRWMKNKYGGPLRGLISENFELSHFVDLVDTPAFLVDVMTYPAITVIQRPEQADRNTATRIAYRPAIEAGALSALAQAMTAPLIQAGSGVIEFVGVAAGSEPWLVHEPERLALVRRLEQQLPTLEGAGCKVGIGVATGCDSVYIADFDALDVEPSRKIPLVRTQDIAGGRVEWQGKGVLNPFEQDGSVVKLESYPRFSAYLERHAQVVKARNVAKRNPDRWFRTIDRITPELANTPKLLVPDIKGDAHIVYEPGKLYPHHNLYYITAQDWDLRALQSVLMSGIARLFVATYSTTMRGGFLRFQAQYLRRIRLPLWADVPEHLREALRVAAIGEDKEGANLATCELYGLSESERAVVLTNCPA